MTHTIYNDYDIACLCPLRYGYFFSKIIEKLGIILQYTKRPIFLVKFKLKAYFWRGFQKMGTICIILYIYIIYLEHTTVTLTYY